MYEISVKADFSGAHSIYHYQGKCREMHGHNWLVEISVLTEKLDRSGMGIDFLILKKEVKKVMDKLDHKNLNKLPFFKKTPPSSENIARFIYEKIEKALIKKKVKLSKVKVSETLNNFVTYWK